MKKIIYLSGGNGMVGRNIIDHIEAKNYTILSPKSSDLNLLNYNETKNCLTDLFHTEFKPNLIICNAGSSSFATGSEIDIKTWHKAFNDNFFRVLYEHFPFSFCKLVIND